MIHTKFFHGFYWLHCVMLGLGAGSLLLVGASTRAATSSNAMNFQEVFQVLKSNLAGATDDSLNEASVKGLLAEMGPRASLLGEEDLGGVTNIPATAVKVELYDKNFVYARIQRLTQDAAEKLKARVSELRTTNTVNGLVLDLRYAGGQNYAAALALADLFLPNETVLVDWGEGLRKSSAKSDSISLPVAILVNRKTSGAAEALAGMMRFRDVGLLIGTNTAGQASMSKIFTLKTGQRLRVAVAPLKVADGSELPLTGIEPDISVAVSPDDELAHYEDAFKVLAKPSKSTTALTNELQASTTNRSPRRRLNEAELVRMSRDGQVFDRESISTNPTPPLPEVVVQVVTDPVLARALDLLKGMAVVRQFRSN